MATHSSISPGKSHGQKSLEGYSPWVAKESDTTEQLNNNSNNKSQNKPPTIFNEITKKGNIQIICHLIQIQHACKEATRYNMKSVAKSINKKQTQVAQMLELVDKDVETAITDILHMFKSMMRK